MLTTAFTMLERGEHANSESQVSHHVHVLVTCSKIHERLLYHGIREKRERERSEGDIRERERDQTEREREIREREGERWHANTYQFRIAIE